MQKAFFYNERQWRNWLKANHERQREIWLVFKKGQAEGQTLSYEASVRQALCFGWVDSIIKRIDELEYARKFSRRRAASKWSPSNKKRAEELIEQDLMERAGYLAIEEAKRNGSWTKPDRPAPVESAPAELLQALKKNSRARSAFQYLPPSHKKQYVTWIAMAKKAATREKRVRESVKLLEQGKPLGLR